jgi:hypothetical protein
MPEKAGIEYVGMEEVLQDFWKRPRTEARGNGDTT